jgi:hypothetical protein
MTRLISDLENYKDVLQKTEARLGKKIKDLTTQLTAKVSSQNHIPCEWMMDL